MEFLLGFALGVLGTIGFSFLAASSYSDDVIDKEYHQD